LIDLLRLARRQANDVAVFLHNGRFDAVAERQSRMFGEVSGFAVDRYDDLRSDPIVHLDQLGPPGMAGYMDVRLALRHDAHAKIGQLVHDAANRDFVARDDPRRKDDRIAFAKLQVMIARGDSAKRGPRLAL